MNRTYQTWITVFTCAALLTAFASCSHQPEPTPQSAQTQPANTAAQNKDIWVSETTGKEYRVALEGDTLRAEWVNIPPDLSAHGAFIKSECKKKDSKWVGTSSSFLPCSAGSGQSAKIDNWCHLETTIEFVSITPDRINGDGETIRKFDCMKCQIVEKGNKDFFWTPKK